MANLGSLEIKNVSKLFDHSKNYAIKDINLKIQPGEFVVIVGPSGSGKSTLLHIVAGMTTPSHGDVLIDGNKVEWPGPDRAVVFQDHGLFPWLNAIENVEFGLKMKKIPKDQRREMALKALETVHLKNVENKLVHELSGGMRQRIAIARALVLDPAVLLMDEPFAALDAQNRTLLHMHMQELWLSQPKTILFVTHSVGEAVRLASRIIILDMNPGRVHQEIKVDIPYPREADSPLTSSVARLVRYEIEQAVTRAEKTK